MNTTPTLIPSSYPELEREVYRSLDADIDRPTNIPPQFEQEELEAESKRCPV